MDGEGKPLDINTFVTFTYKRYRYTVVATVNITIVKKMMRYTRLLVFFFIFKTAVSF